MSERDYTTDVVFPSAFGAFQAPIHLAYVAALGGRQGPAIDRRFTYCDLGTGAGLTLCVLADCYPDSAFHGVDINPEHIRSARDLAARAGLDNVTFHEASFSALAGLDLPPFDFVAMSGIYSWLPPDLRQAALDWAARMLAPDGLVFLHYGALPGNAQIDALYGLIREVAQTLPGDSLARFTAAVERVRRLAKANARFFATNPQATAWLDALQQQDQRSMAHEVLNAQRSSLTARDAADEAIACGLHYVANAQIELNHLDLAAPAAIRDDLRGATPIAREMMLDALRNAHSRMDVLARAGSSTPFGVAAGALMLDRLDRGDELEQRRALAGRTGVAFSDDVFGAVLDILATGAATLGSVLVHPALTRFAPADREGAVQHLIATKLIHLLRRPYAPAPEGGSLRLSSPLNRLLLEERIETAGSLPLASRIAGTQVVLPPADRLALVALVGGDFAAAWRRIQAAGQRVTDRGHPVGSAQDLARVAEKRAAAVGRPMVDRLGRLGIVEAAAGTSRSRSGRSATFSQV